MPDFGIRSEGGGESLDAIARTDRLLDALAEQRRVRPADAGDAALFALLADWRDDVRWPPATDLVSEQAAATALREGLTARPEKRGPHRGLAIVASLAAAVLCIGGFGAVVGTAGPGDPLYGLHTALFGEPQSVRDDRVTLAAQTEMMQVQQLIDQGDWDQAQQKLQAVSTQVETVDDVDAKTDLIQKWNELSVKVGTRDPAATLPPVVPGAPPVEPPPGVTLLELPPVTTTTSSSSTTSSSDTTTTPETTSSDSPTTTPVTTTPVTTTPVTTTQPTTTPATTTQPTTTPPTTTSPSDTPTSQMRASQSPSETSVPPTSEVSTVPSSAAGSPPPPSTLPPSTSTPAAGSTTIAPQGIAPATAPSSVPSSVQTAVTTQAPASVSTAPPNTASVTTITAPAPVTRSEQSVPSVAPSVPFVPHRQPQGVVTTIPLPLPGLGLN